MTQPQQEENDKEPTPQQILDAETFRSLTLQLHDNRQRSDAQHRRTTMRMTLLGVIILFLGVLLWLNNL